MRITILPFLCAAFLPAQQTWIVDAAGGPGVHFTDLPPAVAAAADGDTIEVRTAATPYRAATITKGVTVVGRGPVLLTGALIVRGVGAGRRCSLSGLLLDQQSSYLSVEACAGLVTLASLASGPAAGIPVNILGARAVIAENCIFEGSRGSALVVNDSSLHCIDCVIRGLDTWPPATGATRGILAYDAHLVLVHTAVFGGRLLASPGQQQPALEANRGQTVVTGRCTLVGGGDVAVATSTTTDLVLDPATAVIGSTSSGVRVTHAQLPAWWVYGYGATAQLRYEGLPGDVTALFLSRPTQPFPTPLGEQWLDLSSAVLVDVGAAGAQGGRAVAAAALFALPGADLAAQSVTLRGNALLFSTPLRVVTP